MGVDPREYDVGELRDLADEKEATTDEAFVWFVDGTVGDGTADADESRDDWGSASDRGPDPDPVFASALFAPEEGPTDPGGRSDPGYSPDQETSADFGDSPDRGTSADTDRDTDPDPSSSGGDHGRPAGSDPEVPPEWRTDALDRAALDEPAGSGPDWVELDAPDDGDEDPDPRAKPVGEWEPTVIDWTAFDSTDEGIREEDPPTPDAGSPDWIALDEPDDEEESATEETGVDWIDVSEDDEG